MIRTPQEFVNEVRARFSKRLDDEIKEHGRTVIHFAEENNRFRDERDRLRDIVRNAVETLEQVYKHADMTDALREVVVETQREARAAIGEEAR